MGKKAAGRTRQSAATVTGVRANNTTSARVRPLRSAHVRIFPVADIIVIHFFLPPNPRPDPRHSDGDGLYRRRRRRHPHPAQKSVHFLLCVPFVTVRVDCPPSPPSSRVLRTGWTDGRKVALPPSLPHPVGHWKGRNIK